MNTASRWLPPSRFVTYPSTLAAEEKERLSAMIEEMGMGAMLLPADHKIEVVRSGDADAYTHRRD